MAIFHCYVSSPEGTSRKAMSRERFRRWTLAKPQLDHDAACRCRGLGRVGRVLVSLRPAIGSWSNCCKKTWILARGPSASGKSWGFEFAKIDITWSLPCASQQPDWLHTSLEHDLHDLQDSWAFLDIMGWKPTVVESLQQAAMKALLPTKSAAPKVPVLHEQVDDPILVLGSTIVWQDIDRIGFGDAWIYDYIWLVRGR